MSQTIGETLRKKRESMGLTIQQVGEILKVRSRYIDLLEKGQLENDLARVYHHGYLKNYATFLNLDYKKLLELDKNSEEDGEQGSSGYSNNQIAPINNNDYTPYQIKRKKYISNKKYLAIFLISLLSVWLFFDLIILTNFDDAAENSLEMQHGAAVRGSRQARLNYIPSLQLKSANSIEPEKVIISSLFDPAARETGQPFVENNLIAKNSNNISEQARVAESQTLSSIDPVPTHTTPKTTDLLANVKKTYKQPENTALAN